MVVVVVAVAVGVVVAVVLVTVFQLGRMRRLDLLALAVRELPEHVNDGWAIRALRPMSKEQLACWLLTQRERRERASVRQPG